MSKKIDLQKLVDFLISPHGGGKSIIEIADEFECAKRTVERRLVDVRREFQNVQLDVTLSNSGCNLYRCVRTVAFEQDYVRQDQIVFVGYLLLASRAMGAFGISDGANALETYANHLMRQMPRQTLSTCKQALDRLTKRHRLEGGYRYNDSNAGVVERLLLAILAERTVTVYLRDGSCVSGLLEDVEHRTDRPPLLLLRGNHVEQTVKLSDVVRVEGIEDVVTRLLRGKE